MSCLPPNSDPNVLVGFETNDDSGVYRLTPDLAIVQSLDVVTPIVDDPWAFGQIAAANALSDLYAMGARPRTALNFLALPREERRESVGKSERESEEAKEEESGSAPSHAPTLPHSHAPTSSAAPSWIIDVARQILRGGSEKLAEAGVAILGGHTIDDAELKYGLSVTGVVHPDRILRNSTARAGDGLVLTKAIGTGVVATAIKAGLASESDAAAAVASMSRLNAAACEAALAAGAHACTDVTGFGLLGHLLEMLGPSGVGAVVEAARVPLLPGALGYCGLGMLPGGGARSKDFFACKVDLGGSVGDVLLDLLFDAQTSGGLLISVADAEGLVARLRAAGVADAAVIGRVVAAPVGRVTVK